MSEFTSGILYKSRDTDQVAKYLLEVPCQYKISTLNKGWNVFCLEDGFLQQESTRKFLLGITEVPLLYFLHAEDHGWGYSIYFNNEMTCNVLLDYELEYSMAKKTIKKKFPLEKDIHSIAQPEWTSAFEEVRQSSEYHQALTESLASARPDYFKLFGLEDKSISEVKSILHVSWLIKGENLYQAVDKFKNILGITEMEWISYHYLDEEFLTKTS